MEQQFLTASFHIRQPTNRKADALNVAFSAYVDGAEKLLAWGRDNLEHLRTDGRLTDKEGAPLADRAGNARYTGDSLRRIMPSLTWLNSPLASCVTDALYGDIAGTLASYLMLEQVDPRTGFPEARNTPLDEATRLEILQEFACLADNKPREDELRDALARKVKTIDRPIAYCRSRDFALLVQPDKPSTLYVWLPILRGDNAALPMLVMDGSLLNLADGEMFKKRSKTGVLLPIYLPTQPGHWYYKRFLDRLLSGRAHIKSAKLIHTERGYKFNVSLALDAPDIYTPTAILGVSSGVFESAAWALTDLTGRVLESHSEELGILQMNVNSRVKIRRRSEAGKPVSIRHYKRQAQDEALHKLANYLIGVAKQNNAVIALQNVVDGVETRIGKRAKVGTWIAAPWRKFEFILAYKCTLAGVPLRTGLFGARAGRICNRCGGECESSKDDRWRMATCTVCMNRIERRVLSAINTARRVLYKKKDWETKGGYEGFHRKLALSAETPP